MVLPELQFGSTREALEILKQTVESKAPGKGPKTINVLRPKSDDLHDAVNFMIANYFSGCHVSVVRIERGDTKLSALQDAEHSLPMYGTSANAY
jgi:hypothetical protein